MPSFFRDYAFKFLYHLEDRDFTPEKMEAFLKKNLHNFEEAYLAIDDENPCKNLDSEEKEKALQLIRNVLLNYNDHHSLIDKKLVNRKFAKLDKAVSNILLLGTVELLQECQSFKIIINEYILMAKKYGREDSFALINGVLDAIAKKH